MASFFIKIGMVQDVTVLFSYPNIGHESDSLETTVLRYMGDSLRREATGITNIAVTTISSEVRVKFDHPDPAVGQLVAGRYNKFFTLGLKGMSLSETFRATGKWHPKWKFFLPLGLPLEFGTAVEIMDFPPLTLIERQDYLNSNTTNRWWELLHLNGVSKPELARYTCIVDIVPVAAPARDGTVLDASGIYEGHFDTYSLALLELFSDKSNSSLRRPLIALGLPIRKWLNRVFKKRLEVLETSVLKLPSGEEAPVIASHHPSFFFYASSAHKGADADVKNLAAGLEVMKQDIVTAAWHAELGENPHADPLESLKKCKAKWTNQDKKLIALVRKQARIPISPFKSFKHVHSFTPSPIDLAKLEWQFHYADDTPENFG